MAELSQGQATAKGLLFKGIVFERRGDMYAALECYRDAATAVAVGTDLHTELTQILTSIQGRLAQPGSRGPHYDGGAQGDPEKEEYEVDRCWRLALETFRRGDWSSARQALDLVVKYRPFYVCDQRQGWKFLEEVKRRAAAPDARKSFNWKPIRIALAVILTIGLGYGIAKITQPSAGVPSGQSSPVAGASSAGQPPAGSTVPSGSASPGGQPAGQPRLVLDVPKEVHLGNQLKLTSQIFGNNASYDLAWSSDQGMIVRQDNETWWKPPPNAAAGDQFRLYVQARSADGKASKSVEHVVTVVP